MYNGIYLQVFNYQLIYPINNRSINRSQIYLCGSNGIMAECIRNDIDGHKEGSRAFARYKYIDDEMLTDLVSKLNRKLLVRNLLHQFHNILRSKGKARF